MEVYNKIKIDVLALLIVFCVVTQIFSTIADMYHIGYDDTDSVEYGRSGMQLRVDHGTGCQYLESSNGFLTPRLDFDGNHICIDGDELEYENE